MLLHTLLHPQISAALAAAGHSSKVLIADGNFPASSKRGGQAELVSLNLMPGVVTCNQVLQALLSAVPFEKAETMMYERTGPNALTADPPAWTEFRQSLADAGSTLELTPVERWAFYDAVAVDDHVLTIQTADQQIFANLLLTIGVRK